MTADLVVKARAKCDVDPLNPPDFTTGEVLQLAPHGGDIISASKQFQIAIDQWIDLSTGLNPDSYPIDDIPASAFQHLPYLQPDFVAASDHYYNSSQSIALIGSQMLIACLPTCVQKYPVLLPDVGYHEHRQSWYNAGFILNTYPAFELQATLNYIEASIESDCAQHLVIINPNNPSGLLIEPLQLLAWAEKLASGCHLIVDEAFIDMRPQMSVLRHQWPNNVIVLRSFGKFFGLAGIRIGFAFCQGDLKQKIEKLLGLWMINGPAQYIAAKAMRDTQWQGEAIANISVAAQMTQQLFAPLINYIHSVTASDGHWHCHEMLFSSYQLPEPLALTLQHYFACKGILLRVITLPVGHGLNLTAARAANNQLQQKNALSPKAPSQALLRVGVLSVQNKVQQKTVAQCIKDFIARPLNSSLDSDNI